MVSYDHVDLVIDDELAELTIARPEKKNAISPKVADELADAFERIKRDDKARIVVLTGKGDSFCAGMDLEKRFQEPRKQGPDAYKKAGESSGRFFKTLQSFPDMTIAKVNGWAFGGGYELQGICDISIADEEATFGLSEINFGYFPGGGTMWTLTHSMNRRNAMYYSATGDTFDGEEAAEMGVVTEAVPGDALDDRVDEIVEDLADKNQTALRYNKEVLRRSRYMDFEESQDYERAKAEEMKYYQGDEWVREGIGQFSEREYRPGLDSYDTSRSE